MRFAPGTRVAGVFTQNSFAAAPVQVCRRHLAARAGIRAVVVNAGNANCGTGERGLAAALATCDAAAKLVGCAREEVLPFSTGVILEHLPVDRIEAALPTCFSTLAAAHWADAASSDHDHRHRAQGRVRAGCRSVGAPSPSPASPRAWACSSRTWRRCSPSSPRMRPSRPAALQSMVREVADASFNRVTVDGDTSTNDSFILIATGASGAAEIAGDGSDYRALREAIESVAVKLAQAIARDGEGATKFITVRVEGGADDGEALRVARSIANSPLVKTAFFASDPNLGRLLMAIGNAGIADLDTSRVNLWLGDVQVIERGGRAASYREEDGARVMKPEEITVRVDLGRGQAATTVWTCDYSYDYVKINAEYRT